MSNKKDQPPVLTKYKVEFCIDAYDDAHAFALAEEILLNGNGPGTVVDFNIGFAKSSDERAPVSVKS